jgi:hypothetical protein
LVRHGGGEVTIKEADVEFRVTYATADEVDALHGDWKLAAMREGEKGVIKLIANNGETWASQLTFRGESRLDLNPANGDHTFVEADGDHLLKREKGAGRCAIIREGSKHPHSFIVIFNDKGVRDDFITGWKNGQKAAAEKKAKDQKAPAKTKAPVSAAAKKARPPEPEPEEPDRRLVVGAKVTWKAQERRNDGGWYSTGPRIPFDQTTVGEIMSVTKKGDLRVEFLKRNPVTDTDTSSHDIKPNMLEFVE